MAQAICSVCKGKFHDSDYNVFDMVRTRQGGICKSCKHKRELESESAERQAIRKMELDNEKKIRAKEIKAQTEVSKHRIDKVTDMIKDVAINSPKPGEALEGLRRMGFRATDPPTLAIEGKKEDN